MRMLIALLLAGIASSSCFSQEAQAPATLAGFLKPGTNVGIWSRDDADGVKITIYSKPDFEIAQDARRLDLDALAAKYEKVAEARDRRLEEFTASLESKRDVLPSGTEFGEPKVSLSVNRREGLYTIVHAGDDYIIASYGEDQTKRRVYATRFISTIDWHDGLGFNTSVRHVTKTADRTNR